MEIFIFHNLMNLIPGWVFLVVELLVHAQITSPIATAARTEIIIAQVISVLFFLVPGSQTLGT